MSLQNKVAKNFVSRLKDKDLMNDTGGTTKKRPAEPHQKPPREDKMKPRRKKRKTPSERDQDTDNDPDLKKSYNEIHPLDREENMGNIFMVPEDNFYRRVYNSIVNILAEERNISEKDFTNSDKIMNEADNILRMPEVMSIVENMQDKRPSLCAEMIYEGLR